MTNPFMARTKPTGDRRESPPVTPGGSVVEPSRVELEDMRKADLVELARARKLDTDGTKAELVDRLAP